MPDNGVTFTRNWLRFGGLLRSLGFEAGPARMLPFLTALTLLAPVRNDDLRAAVRAHFARRRDDLHLLDQALAAFLVRAGGAQLQAEVSTRGDQPTPAPEPPSEHATMRQLSVLEEPETEDEGAETQEVAAYSRVEALRHKDLEALTDEELQEVRQLIRMMRIPAGIRRSRRFRTGGGERVDLRRMLRASLRFEGEPLLYAWRSRRWKARPLVLLCDISGSMERYTRVLLHFVYAMTNAGERVEVFVFATRLTRITRQLRSHDPDAALSRVIASVEDWSGGTRIGEAIETFNQRFARRVLGFGATVVLISDGWDRGDALELSRAIARLQRSCYRLIWLNPLLGAPGYEPLTLGLRAALPYVDDFLPAHNLASLQALGHLLLELQDRRPVRRQALLSA